MPTYLVLMSSVHTMLGLKRAKNNETHSSIAGMESFVIKGTCRYLEGS